MKKVKIKTKKRKGRRLTVHGLYLEVEKAVRALTQLFSDKRVRRVQL